MGILFSSHIPRKWAHWAIGDRHRGRHAATQKGHFTAHVSPLTASPILFLCVCEMCWRGTVSDVLPVCRPWGGEGCLLFPQGISCQCQDQLLGAICQTCSSGTTCCCIDVVLWFFTAGYASQHWRRDRHHTYLAQKSSRQLAPCLHLCCTTLLVMWPILISAPIHQVLLS